MGNKKRKWKNGRATPRFYRLKLFKFCREKLSEAGITTISIGGKSYGISNVRKNALKLKYFEIFNRTPEDDFDPNNLNLLSKKKAEKLVKREIISDISRLKSVWWDKYNEHLNSSAWKKFRSEILELYDNTCQKCNKKFENSFLLHVHHLHYKTLGNEKVEDVMLLCVKCHEEVHNRKFTTPRPYTQTLTPSGS